MSLCDILDERASVLESADDLTPEQSQELESYLDGLAREAGEKIDHYISYRREELDRAAAKRSEAQRLIEQARAIERKWNRMDTYYVSVMQNHGLKQIKGKAYTLGLRMSKRIAFAPTFSLDGLDEMLVRKTVKIEPNKIEIEKRLKEGQDIDGVSFEEHWSIAVK